MFLHFFYLSAKVNHVLKFLDRKSGTCRANRAKNLKTKALKLTKKTKLLIISIAIVSLDQ